MAFNDERKRLLFKHLIQFWSKPTLKALGKYQISFTIINLKNVLQERLQWDNLKGNGWIRLPNQEGVDNRNKCWNSAESWMVLLKTSAIWKSSDRFIPSLLYFFPSLLPFLILIITLWNKNNSMTFISFLEIFGVSSSNISMESNLAKIELTHTQSWL